MTVATCSGIRKNGEPCSANARPGTDLCPWHTPELAAQRATWSAKGGKESSNKARARKALPAEPLTNAETHAWLSLAFKKTLTGQMEPGVFSSLASGAKVLAELSKAVDLEDQLADMRQKIVDLSERRPA